MKSCLVTQTKLCIINQSNSVSWHVLMVWRNNNKHPVFPRIKRVRARCMVKKVGGEQKRGIRSEKLARQAKAWTTEIVWIFVYTHTGYKRITHGFMFTYIKKYPRPRGVCCKTTYSDIDVARFTGHKLKLSLALGACNFAMAAARSLNSVQAMKTETVQTRQLFGISECALAHWTGYFIMKIVQQGLYIHEKVGNKVTFQKFRPSCWRFREWLWKGTMKFLSCHPDLINSVSLTNQIAFLDMFWWFDGRIRNILYFREF